MEFRKSAMPESESNKQEKSPVLPLGDLPVIYHANERWCKDLVKGLERFGKKWIIYPKAHASLTSRIPEFPGLYMFVWRPKFHISIPRNQGNKIRFSWPIYVGRTDSDTLKSRYQAYATIMRNLPHQPTLGGTPAFPRQQGRKFLLKTYLQYPVEYWCLTVSANELISEMENLEKKLIGFFNPPVNKQHTWHRGRNISAEIAERNPAW